MRTFRCRRHSLVEMAMDVLLMQRQLRQTLSNLILQVAAADPVLESKLSEVLADGLTRYLIYTRKTQGREEQDFDLLIDSLEFWAGKHGYTRRKPVQKQNGPATLTIAASAG